MLRCIEGAERIGVDNSVEAAKSLPRDKTIASTCSVGYRGGLRASIFRLGFKEISNVLSGIKAWKNLGYALKVK